MRQRVDISVAGRVALAALWLLTALDALATETLQGRIVAIVDGDTVTLLDAENSQHRIRLSGIDAPEKGQAFGQRAKQAVSDLVFGQFVEARCSKVDRYRRKICQLVTDGRDINLVLVQMGMAWWYRHYSAEQTPEDQLRYEAAENSAGQHKAGLWSDPNPVPPWDWRRNRIRK